MEILRGTAGDVPWPELFATLAYGGETCELVVEAGLQVHRVAFGDHAVIGASSPLASDSALRLMRTHGVITPAMMPTIASRVAASPSADPIEVLAEVAELSADTTLLMRRRALAVAATRVFALVNGSYRASHEVTLPIHPSAAIDVRALIYEGVRTHLTDDQLAGAATRQGTMFVLRAEVWEDLPQFGFSPSELPMVDELRAGASLTDLVGRYPAIGARGVNAIVTTLLAARALDAMPARISDRLPVQRTSGQFSTQAPVTGRFAARTSGTFDIPAVPDLDAAEQTDPGRTTSTFELAEQPDEPPALASATLDLEAQLHEQPTHTNTRFDFDEPPGARSDGDTFELAEQPHSRVSATFPVVETPGIELAPASSSGSFAVAELAPPESPAAEPPGVGPARAFTTQPPTTGVFAMRPERRVTSTPPMPHPALELPPPPLQRPPSGTHAAIPPPLAPRPPSATLPPPPIQRPPSGTHAAIPAHPALERPARRATTPNPAINPQPVARLPSSHPSLDPPAPRRPSTPNPAVDPRAVARTPEPPARPTPIPVRPTPMPARTTTLQGAAVATPTAPAAPAEPEVTAAQHHERGLALLDRDLPRAVAELRTAFQMSGDVDHEAALAWAVFCAAPNKETVAKNTKAVLARAIYQSERPAIAHFYYGRMERMLGRDREALAQFKTVVEQMPRHAEALAEIRMLEARLGPRKK